MLKSLKALSDKLIRKFTEVLDAANWQIESDKGWNDIKTVNKTVPYAKVTIYTKFGKTLTCADNHILITAKDEEIFAKDSKGKYIKTRFGPDEVIRVVHHGELEEMYDFSLGDNTNHLYYANDILSHNSTLMTIVATWSALFFPDQTIVIIANKQSTATEIFNRVRLAFIQMDNWIKGGVIDFNKTFFTLANGSRIITSATDPDAIRGFAVDVLLLDEFAIIPPKVAEEFWAAVTPTLATRFNNNKNAKLIVSSTPKGIGNKFYDLCSRAEQGQNDFALEKAYWYDFPGRDENWKENELKSMDYETFLQEYECAFLNNSGSPFKPEMFDKFDLEYKEPVNELEDGNYLIWELPDKDKIYAIGVDTSEGIGQDFSVAQIFDITDPLAPVQVARYSTDSMDTTTWASKIREITKQWFNPVLLIERNGPGTTPCDKLFKEWAYPRFINHCSSSASMLNRGKNCGIISTAGTKLKAILNMKYYINDRMCVKIYDKKTVNELRVFTRKNADTNHPKWEAQVGFHDDHVMAMAWALFVLHTEIINQWLIVTNANGDGIPIEIAKRWQFNPTLDYDKANDLYAKTNNDPYVGVMVTKHHLAAHDPRMYRDSQPQDRMAQLLQFGEMISVQDRLRGRPQQTPQSFSKYGVRNRPNIF